MTITADTQVEFNGLRLDGRYEIQSIEGLAGAPEVRTSDLPLAGRHGMYPGIDLLGGRVVTITVAVWAWTEAEFKDAVQALRTAFQPGAATETPLTFQLSGVGDGIVRINARARRLALPQTSVYWQQAAEAVIELFATDPRIYSDTLNTVTLTRETSVAGHIWPQTWPMNWGGAVASGSTIVTNTGTFPAEMVLRFGGPVSDPGVENVTTGATLTFGIGLAAGEYLLVDTDARSVLLNGTASRYSTLLAGSTWPNLALGDNDIRFTAATATDAPLTITWRSAWV